MKTKFVESNFSIKVVHRPNEKAIAKIREATGRIVDLLKQELEEDNDIKSSGIRFEFEQDVTEWYT